jgi:hypothetical protein
MCLVELWGSAGQRGRHNYLLYVSFCITREAEKCELYLRYVLLK